MNGATVQRFKYPQTISFHVAFLKKKLTTTGEVSNDEKGTFILVDNIKFYKVSLETLGLTQKQGAELNKKALEILNQSIKLNKPDIFFNSISKAGNLEASKKQKFTELINMMSEKKNYFDRSIEEFPQEATLTQLDNGIISAQNFVVLTDNSTLELTVRYIPINGSYEMLGLGWKFSESE